MRKKEEQFFSVDVIVGDSHSFKKPFKNGYFSPQMDIYESENGVFVEVELPGVDAGDIKLLFNNNRLVIKGVKQTHYKGGNQKYHLLERPYGLFEKVIELHHNIDPDKINANLKDGILLISMCYKSGGEVKID